MRFSLVKYLGILCAFWLFAPEAQAGSTHVAIASNFMAPAKEIAKAFQAETGHKAILSFGSTGKIYAQIIHGAPYEVFLAADQKRPALIEGERFTYAEGRLALYPAINGDVLNEANFARLAIANPKTAPYGAAAIEVLEKLGVYEKFKNKLVRGENIAQTYQFVATRNAQYGFVALSQVIDKQKWIVPTELYQPIKQDAVLVKNTEAGKAFFEFLRSVKAKSIMSAYGY